MHLIVHDDVGIRETARAGLHHRCVDPVSLKQSADDPSEAVAAQYIAHSQPPCFLFPDTGCEEPVPGCVPHPLRHKQTSHYLAQLAL